MSELRAALEEAWLEWADYPEGPFSQQEKQFFEIGERAVLAWMREKAGSGIMAAMEAAAFEYVDAEIDAGKSPPSASRIIDIFERHLSPLFVMLKLLPAASPSAERDRELK